MSIKSKIQSLIAAANAKTGESDATLTDAVQTLVDGYGQGGGGDSSLLNSLIDGTITSINYSGSTIRNNAFYECRQLETISAPDVTTIGGSAFGFCEKLKNLLFPKASSIGNDAFKHDFEIEEVTTTNFPLITSIGTTAFLNCKKLTRVFCPNASVGQRAFSGCSSLKTAVSKSFNYYLNFESCSALEAADKTGSGNVVATLFKGCGVLTVLVLRSSTLCALSNTNAFDGTPFASGGAGGTLYVPQALVSQYTQATNWSTILGYANNQILPIEGSIYETQYADGTPIT
jgi:hypothetical protein